MSSGTQVFQYCGMEHGSTALECFNENGFNDFILSKMGYRDIFWKRV